MGFRFLYPLLDRAGLTFLLRDEFIQADAAPLQDAVADSGTVTTGTVNSGTYASTAANDGTNWEINEVAGTPGFLLTMDFTTPVPGQSATKLIISGNYDGNAGHTVDVDAYDWVADTYDTLGQLPDAAAEDVYSFTLESSHTDTDGTIRIRINHSSAGNATHILYLDWVYVQDLIRPCKPGPGTWNIGGTSWAISYGKLQIPGGVAGSTHSMVGSAQTRAAGLALISKNWNRSAVTDFHGGPAGWSDNLTVSGGGSGNAAVDWDAYLMPNSANLKSLAQVSGAEVGAYAALTDYDTAYVLRSAGAFYFIKGGAFSNWTLLWVDNSTSTAMVYPRVYARDIAATIDAVKVAQLPAPFNTDNDIATDSIASPIATDTFTHEADCLIEFTVETRPTVLAIKIIFRKQDASNYWYLLCDNTSINQIKLYEYVSDTPTLRGSGAYSTTGRLVLVADDDDITVYYDNTQVFTYASASNFKTATAGQVNALGTGGAISDLITWPRTLSGTAKAILDKFSA